MYWDDLLTKLSVATKAGVVAREVDMNRITAMARTLALDALEKETS